MIRQSGSIFSGICWSIGVFIIGLSIIGLQIDRAARANAAIAQLVPSYFRVYALEALAREAYAKQEYASGLAYSRELVLRRPVPAEGLSLLTRGLLMEKREQEALPILLLSAQRGWRDRFIQQLMITLALQVDDTEIASQRLLALWRLGEHTDHTMALTLDVMKTTDGFDLFRQSLNKDDTWAMAFLTWGKHNLPIQYIENMSISLKQKHVEIDCRSLSNVVRALAQTGNGQTAINVWSRLCSTAPVTTAADFTFKNTDNKIGPFDWTYLDHAGLILELVEDAGKLALKYDYSEQLSIIVAKRFSELPAGTHIAKIEAKSRRDMGSRPSVMRIHCLSHTGVSNWSTSIEISDEAIPFQIPASECKAQEIQLIVGHGSGVIRSVIIN